MARVKKVCSVCGNIISITGDSFTSGGDYMDARIIFVDGCSSCKSNRRAGCAGSLILIIAIIIIALI